MFKIKSLLSILSTLTFISCTANAMEEAAAGVEDPRPTKVTIIANLRGTPKITQENRGESSYWVKTPGEFSITRPDDHNKKTASFWADFGKDSKYDELSHTVTFTANPRTLTNSTEFKINLRPYRVGKSEYEETYYIMFNLKQTSQDVLSKGDQEITVYPCSIFYTPPHDGSFVRKQGYFTLK